MMAVKIMRKMEQKVDGHTCPPQAVSRADKHGQNSVKKTKVSSVPPKLTPQQQLHDSAHIKHGAQD